MYVPGKVDSPSSWHFLDGISPRARINLEMAVVAQEGNDGLAPLGTLGPMLVFTSHPMPAPGDVPVRVTRRRAPSDGADGGTGDGHDFSPSGNWADATLFFAARFGFDR